MPTGNQAAVGGKVAAALTNQYGDFPPAVSMAQDATNRTISSATFANIPGGSIAASIVLTRTSLVAVTISGQYGSGSFGTLTASGLLSAALSGALTEAASDFNAMSGATPGSQIVGGSFTFWRVVPAGTLTATLQARVALGASLILRNHMVQIAAIRLA